MQTRQHAMAVVPAEGKDVFPHVIRVVLVEAVLSPVIYLQKAKGTHTC